MLTDKEVRIGNLVKSGNGIYAVSGIMEDAIVLIKDNNGEHINILEVSAHIGPISLTPEWLERFGFIKDKDGIWYKTVQGPGHPCQRFDLEWRNDLGFLCKSRYQEWNEGYKMKHIVNVHELQNLCYSLTGEEIEIKIKSEAPAS